MKDNFYKTALGISIILFVLFAGAFFLLYRQIKTNNGIADQALLEAENEANRREEIRLLDRSLAAISEERIALDTHFARSFDVVPFFDSIEALAPKTGTSAQVASVDLSPERATLTVGIRATGSFEGLYKFVRLLENSPHELEFASLAMEKIDEGWQADFKVKLISFIP